MTNTIPESARCTECRRPFAEHDWQGGCPELIIRKCDACDRYLPGGHITHGWAGTIETFACCRCASIQCDTCTA